MHKMLRHLISMTYFYVYFNQFKNVLESVECYEPGSGVWPFSPINRREIINFASKMADRRENLVLVPSKFQSARKKTH